MSINAKVKINGLKKGEWFTKKDIEEPKESQVWVRGEYNRSEKKYEIYKWSDVNDVHFISGNKEVFVGFTF